MCFKFLKIITRFCLLIFVVNLKQRNSGKFKGELEVKIHQIQISRSQWIWIIPSLSVIELTLLYKIINNPMTSGI